MTADESKIQQKIMGALDNLEALKPELRRSDRDFFPWKIGNIRKPMKPPSFGLIRLVKMFIEPVGLLSPNFSNGLPAKARW